VIFVAGGTGRAGDIEVRKYGRNIRRSKVFSGNVDLPAKKGPSMDKFRYFVEQSWLLIVSAFLFGLLLAATNYALAPTIRQNRIDKLNSLAKGLLPDAEHFIEVPEPVQIRSPHGKVVEVTIYRAIDEAQRCIGWSFTVSGSGFADRIDLVVAVDAGFEELRGYDVLSSNETAGFGDKIKDDYYRGQFRGIPLDRLTVSSTGDASKLDTEIIAISGATISSEAVVSIMNDAVLQVKEQVKKKGLIGDGQ